jgi:hypothetical protein
MRKWAGIPSLPSMQSRELYEQIYFIIFYLHLKITHSFFSVRRTALI